MTYGYIEAAKKMEKILKEMKSIRDDILKARKQVIKIAEKIGVEITDSDAKEEKKI